MEKKDVWCAQMFDSQDSNYSFLSGLFTPLMTLKVKKKE